MSFRIRKGVGHARLIKPEEEFPVDIMRKIIATLRIRKNSPHCICIENVDGKNVEIFSGLGFKQMCTDKITLQKSDCIIFHKPTGVKFLVVFNEDPVVAAKISDTPPAMDSLDFL